MTAQNDVAELVRDIIVSLVDEVDQVQVTTIEDGDTTVIEVRVAPDDVGKIIGRQGRIIKAIRTLVRAVSSYDEESRIEVEVVD